LEVFVISGQSNARGGRPPEGGFISNEYYGATDDRVNCINYFHSTITDPYPFPIISKIEAETYIAPTGRASWCWALLGDKIAQTLNVPVLFLNAAIGATKISQWKNAAFNEPVYDYYSPIPNTYITSGWPYIDLKKTLNYYSKIFGVRAIIWQQGEDDLAYFDAI
jgi:Carbohydrate esterase, sialic acid-specific acetylesterase